LPLIPNNIVFICLYAYSIYANGLKERPRVVRNARKAMATRDF
jgi:hypothetical protein